MPTTTNVITGRDEVRAVLDDPESAVPRVPAGGEPGVRWLRANVARFSEGADHQRRRSLATTALTNIDATKLHQAAFDRTSAVLMTSGGQPVDLLADVARTVPVELLAEALGMASISAADVAAVARAYHPPVEPDRAADQALCRLLRACGDEPDEATAAKIGLLVQAAGATAGLIGNAVRLMHHRPGDPVDTILAETLHTDPPVRLTRRVTATGAVIPLDLATGGLPFGHGRHACPGRDHALAIAGGILAAVSTE